jgi:hypothetical protein
LDFCNMSKNILRAGAAAGAVVLSAGTGLATNLLTDRPSWGVGTAVAVLVIAGVALAVTLSVVEHRGSTPPQQAPEPPAAGKGSSFSTRTPPAVGPPRRAEIFATGCQPDMSCCAC